MEKFKLFYRAFLTPLITERIKKQGAKNYEKSRKRNDQRHARNPMSLPVVFGT